MNIGRHLGVTNIEFNSINAISKSDLDLVNRSPFHFKYEKDNPTPIDKEAVLFERALKCAIFSPDIFVQHFVCELMPEDVPGCLQKTDEIKSALEAFYKKDIQAIETPMNTIERQ